MKIYKLILIWGALLLFNPFLSLNTPLLAQEELIEPDEVKVEVKKKEPIDKKKVEEQELLEEETGKREIPERLKYYKEKYEELYSKPFEVVWNAVKMSIDDLSCMIASDKYSQTDEGLYKGKIESDYCVFTRDRDSTFDVLKKYSYEMPVIRGGRWITGRIQFKFLIKEEPDGKVRMNMRTELSGFEEYVTHEVHFWKSNGYLEHNMLESIKKNIAKYEAKKE